MELQTANCERLFLLVRRSYSIRIVVSPSGPIIHASEYFGIRGTSIAKHSIPTSSTRYRCHRALFLRRSFCTHGTLRLAIYSRCARKNRDAQCERTFLSLLAAPFYLPSTIIMYTYYVLTSCFHEGGRSGELNVSSTIVNDSS